ncbi:hypothetical protein COLO4_04834 [Corchorus olitorius]|uniref:Uncharacterized protein n=1 Tax=Corchorus olitorius TaxID=93759 RepID=A0A1R3KSP7_9ROSI|nr:hypothetical protein COLO4_04834 [Corchorus olitorius]
MAIPFEIFYLINSSNSFSPSPPPVVRGRGTPPHPLPYIPPSTTGGINNSCTSGASSSSSQQPPVPEKLFIKPPTRRPLEQPPPPPDEQPIPPPVQQPPPPLVEQHQEDQPSPGVRDPSENLQPEHDIDEGQEGEEDYVLEEELEAKELTRAQQHGQPVSGFNGLGGPPVVPLPERPAGDPEGPIMLDDDMLASDHECHEIIYAIAEGY